MITFKSIADLSKLPPTDPSRAVIHGLLGGFSRAPDIHGYIVLVQSGDTFIDLSELKSIMADMSWDGVTKQDGFFHAVFLTNNEFALEFVIPDAEWLAADLRDSLESQAQRSPPYLKEAPF